MTKLLFSGILFGLVFFFFNPFFYGRFVDGQRNVYMSLLLLPIVIGTYHHLMTTNQIKISAPLFLIALSCFITVSIHNSIFIAIFGCIATIVYTIILGFNIKNFFVSGLIFVLVGGSLFRYVTTKNGPSTDLLSVFDQTHLQAFQVQNFYTNNTLGSLVTLHGYRGESMYRFQPSFLTNQRRYVSRILFIVIIFIGSIKLFGTKNKERRALFITILLMGGLGILLAGGTSWQGRGSNITQYLYDHVYVYRGMREPHKRMMRVVVWYCMAGMEGIQTIVRLLDKYKFEKNIQYSMIGLITILPIISTPALLFGAQGQVKIGNYPQERYSLRTTLKNYQGNNKCGALNDGKQYCRSMLVLPRHGYLSFPFTQGRVVANPIYGFMGNTGLMVSDTVEIGALYSQTTKRENIVYQNNIYPLLSGLLYESDLDHTRDFDFVNDAIIRKIAHQFAYIGIKDVVVFKTSSNWKNDVDRLSFLVLHGYATIDETNDQYVWYKLNLNDRLARN